MDLNDYTTSKTIPWKPLAIGIGVLMLAVATVFVTVRLVQNARTPSGEMLSPTVTGVCEEFDDVRARDNCVWAVARELKDANLCEAIVDVEWRSRCGDGIHQNFALSSREVEACEAIADEARRRNCIDTLTAPKDVASCDPQTFPEWCRDLEIQEAAMATLDVGMCRDILDEERYENCYELVLTAVNEREDEPSIEESDTDEDGLEDLMELTVYFTDPLNPDTDGDGYLDGAEVAAGYNPNGSGKLE